MLSWLYFIHNEKRAGKKIPVSFESCPKAKYNGEGRRPLHLSVAVS